MKNNKKAAKNPATLGRKLEGASKTYKQFHFHTDTDELVGITNRRSVKLWRFEQTAALAVLKSPEEGLECLTYSKLTPSSWYS